MQTTRALQHSVSASSVERSDHYFLSIVKSPIIFLLPVFATMALPAWGLSILLMVVAVQLASWFILPRIAWVRARVDDADRAREQWQLAAARAALLQRIAIPHRRAFEHLQHLVADVGERLGADDHREASLRWLLSNYLSLALAHNATSQDPLCNGHAALIDEITAIDVRAQAAPPRLRKLLEQRKLIAQRRLAQLDRTTADLECMEAELAAIDATVHLAYESTMRHIPTQGVQVEIDAALAEFADRLSSLDEPDERTSAETIDPRIFEGRGSMQHAHVCERAGATDPR